MKSTSMKPAMSKGMKAPAMKSMSYVEAAEDSKNPKTRKMAMKAEKTMRMHKREQGSAKDY